jgi:hypothetical protein
MEPMISKNPELWLWSYKQWRYKPSTAPEGQYPFYANATKRFDEILQGEPPTLGGTTSGLSQD